MGVVGQRIGRVFSLSVSYRIVGHRTGIPQTIRYFRIVRIIRIVRVIRIILRQIHHRSVYTLPVVRILALTPLLFKAALTLADALRIIEIPGTARRLLCRCVRVLTAGLLAITYCRLFL